ncbi:MAG: TIGR01458 family HAD-type hydrolase [Bryobacteraceae bacterium]|jgi:HAD superfamily hydrolase (TIGR01458 family)
MRGILFDLDGVLYNGEEPIPGSAEALAWVREQRIPHLFVTNTTSRGAEAIAEKLSGFGIPAGAEQILTPPRAAATWLADRPRGPLALFVPPKTQPEFASFEVLPEDRETGADYVIVGDLGERWSFRTLNRAFRLLHNNPAATLIALGMTRFWQAPDGPRLDTAPFVAALEHATGRHAVVLGKPSQEFFDAAVSRLGLTPGDVLMIGDDIRTDIAGAQAAGLRAALVRTGKFRPKDLDEGIRPDAVLDSIADLPEWWSR